MLWIAGVLQLVLAMAVARFTLRLASVRPMGTALMELRLRPAMRLGGVLVLLLACVALVVPAWLATHATGTSEAVFWCGSAGIGAALTSAVASAMARSNVLFSEVGIFVGGISLPWREVTAIWFDGQTLFIRAPRSRQAWPGWKGLLALDRSAYPIGPGEYARLAQHFPRYAQLMQPAPQTDVAAVGQS